MDLKPLKKSLKTNGLMDQLINAISGSSPITKYSKGIFLDCIVKSGESCVVKVGDPPTGPIR